MVYHPDYTSQIGLFPQSPDETLFVHTMVVPHEPTSDKEDLHWSRSFDLIQGTVFEKEDIHAAESIQSGLRSGANETLTLGGFEFPIQMFHDIVDKAMDSNRDTGKSEEMKQ